MIFRNLQIIPKLLRWRPVKRRFCTQNYEYEMPETYRNAFYVANASLVETTNWFIHNALGAMYNEIITELKSRNYTSSEAVEKVSSIMNILEPCNLFIDVQFPVKKRNGQYEIFRGFRAEHGVHIINRPCLGGLRLCPRIESSDIKALALISTYKYACMGIDMLGAHGGIAVDLQRLSSDELQKIIETYIQQLTKKGFCGESIDIFEPDMNCGSNEMKWVIAANSKVSGKVGNACAVGKPVSFGGVRNRDKAVAQGIFFGLDTFLHDHKIMDAIGLEPGWGNKTFILQGLGNVGSCTSLYLESAGLKCVGIVEYDCHIHNPEGISVRDAVFYKRKHGSLDGFQSYTKYFEPNKLLTEKCDILVLAAKQNSLVYYIADKVNAKVIVEAAYGPLSPAVHKILIGHNKLVLPDIYINGGLSIVSYFEYLKNLQHLSAKPAEDASNKIFMDILMPSSNTITYKSSYGQSNDSNLRQKLLLDCSEKNVVTEVIDKIMQQTAKDIMTTAQVYQLGLDFRTAAYVNSLKKLFWIAYKNSENECL